MNKAKTRAETWLFLSFTPNHHPQPSVSCLLPHWTEHKSCYHFVMVHCTRNDIIREVQVVTKQYRGQEVKAHRGGTVYSRNTYNHPLLFCK